MGRFMQIYISLSWAMRSDLNGQLDLMLDEDAVEYKPKRGCLKTGLVKRLDQQTASQKVTREKCRTENGEVGKWVSAFLLLPLKIFCSVPPSPAAERSILYLFVFLPFLLLPFQTVCQPSPLGFVEFSSRIAPMRASSANTFVFKQLDEAALTEKDPTLTFTE